MHIVRDPTSVTNIADPEIRNLVEQLFIEICDDEPYDYDRHGYMIIVEAGDTVEALEEVTGCHILHDPSTGTRFGDSGFRPSFEFVEEYVCCYRADFTLNDDGFGVAILVPKVEGINGELLQLCAHYAEPVHEEVVVAQP